MRLLVFSRGVWVRNIAEASLSHKQLHHSTAYSAWVLTKDASWQLPAAQLCFEEACFPSNCHCLCNFGKGVCESQKGQKFPKAFMKTFHRLEKRLYNLWWTGVVLRIQVEYGIRDSPTIVFSLKYVHPCHQLTLWITLLSGQQMEICISQHATLY